MGVRTRLGWDLVILIGVGGIDRIIGNESGDNLFISVELGIV